MDVGVPGLSSKSTYRLTTPRSAADGMALVRRTPAACHVRGVSQNRCVASQSCCRFVHTVARVTRGQLILYGAVVVAVVLLGARYLRQAPDPVAGGGPRTGTPAAADRTLTTAPAEAVTVHVAGAVRRAGVYRLKAGERVDDALRRAGGATAKADLGAVNLAAKVEDGRQILVPERVRGGAPGTPAGAGAAGGGVGGVGGVGAAPAARAAPGVPLDLNTATLEQLDTLPGVGPATAQKILAYRDEHGGFGSVDELGQVPGIGDKRLATLRELVRV